MTATASTRQRMPTAATIPAQMTCAAPDCERPVERTRRPGRPAIYCSPACRPTHQRTTTRRAGGVVVEVDHPATSPDGRPTKRVWSVRLRRGVNIVVIADDLGWPTANALTQDLNDLLFPQRQKGAPID